MNTFKQFEIVCLMNMMFLLHMFFLVLTHILYLRLKRFSFLMKKDLSVTNPLNPFFKPTLRSLLGTTTIIMVVTLIHDLIVAFLEIMVLVVVGVLLSCIPKLNTSSWISTMFDIFQLNFKYLTLSPKLSLVNLFSLFITNLGFWFFTHHPKFKGTC